MAGIIGDGVFRALTGSAVGPKDSTGDGNFPSNQQAWAEDEQGYCLLDEAYLRRIYLMACGMKNTSEAREQKNCEQKETGLSGNPSLHSGRA